MKWATLLIADRQLHSKQRKFIGVIFDQQRVPDDFPVYSAGTLTWHASEEFGGSVVNNTVKPENMTEEQAKAWEFALLFAEICLRQGYVPGQKSREWDMYLFT